jgi:hypothetical protein
MYNCGNERTKHVPTCLTMDNKQPDINIQLEIHVMEASSNILAYVQVHQP